MAMICRKRTVDETTDNVFVPMQNIEPGKLCCVNPAELFKDVVLQCPGESREVAIVHFEGAAVVVVRYLNFVPFKWSGLERELFPQFPPCALFDGFPVFDFSSREFPLELISRPLLALAHEDFFVVDKNADGDLLHGRNIQKRAGHSKVYQGNCRLSIDNLRLTSVERRMFKQNDLEGWQLVLHRLQLPLWKLAFGDWTFDAPSSLIPHNTSHYR